MLILKKKRKISRNSLRLLVTYSLGFILAVSTALPAYIQSNFLEQFVSLEMVSLFFILANIISIFAITSFPRLIRTLSNFFVAKLVVVTYFVSLLGLVLANSPLAAFASLTLLIVSINLIWINIDIILEGITSNKKTGRVRTTYLTFVNIGWILAPTFSGYLVSVGGYSLTYLISAAIVIPFFVLLLLHSHRAEGRMRNPKEGIVRTFKKLWKNKNLRGIFCISFLLNLFYSSAVVYIPIHLHQTMGMSWTTLGLIFSIMLIPFVLLEIPAGILADKYIGEKEIMTLGVFILACSLFLFYYISTPIVWLWALVLFFSRVGASLIEAMRETYFFKLVDAEDVGYINIFRTTGPLGYIVGPGLAMLTLLFFPLHYLFLIISIITLTGFIFIYPIKDTK